MNNALKIMGGLLVAATITGGVLLSSFGRQMSELQADSKAGFNGGFEVVRNGLPVNWLMYTPRTVPGASFTIGYDTTTPHGGHRALLLDVRQCAATGGWRSSGLAQEIAVTPGATYNVTLWLRTKGAQTRINIAPVSAKGMAPGVNETLTQNAPTWQPHTYHIAVPKNMHLLRLELNVFTPGVVAVDDISVGREYY